VTLTTNGLLLEELAQPPAEAGLDSLNKDQYYSFSGFDVLSKVHKGLSAAYNSRIPSLKVNCVPLAQTQPEDLLALAYLARDRKIYICFY
jgi:molybdenum cofactor biosynthesis enzyme MoaA